MEKISGSIRSSALVFLYAAALMVNASCSESDSVEDDSPPPFDYSVVISSSSEEEKKNFCAVESGDDRKIDCYRAYGPMGETVVSVFFDEKSCDKIIRSETMSSENCNMKFSQLITVIDNSCDVSGFLTEEFVASVSNCSPFSEDPEVLTVAP